MLEGVTVFSLGVAVTLSVTNVDSFCGFSVQVCAGVVADVLVGIGVF